MKKSLIICIGESGSGKTYFIDKYLLPDDLFYNLRSFTTRARRPDEQEGNKYFFVDEKTFFSQKRVTTLWVNEKFWTPEKPKWLYGVPEFEVLDNLGKNLVYDVIEPHYARQMVDWFTDKKLDAEYNIKLAWFVPPINNDIVAKRANMPDDVVVRQTNTCTIHDILDAGFKKPHFILSPRRENLDPELLSYIGSLYSDMELMRSLEEKSRHGYVH